MTDEIKTLFNKISAEAQKAAELAINMRFLNDTALSRMPKREKIGRATMNAVDSNLDKQLDALLLIRNSLWDYLEKKEHKND